MADSFHVEPSRSEILALCPICDGREFLPSLRVIDHSISHEVFDLQTCNTCGYCATSPRPTPDQIGRYYESDAYISHTNSSRGVIERIYQSVRRSAIRNKHGIVAKYQPTGRVLDVGCGTGDFLAHLRDRGYHVQGVEPSDRARELAVSQHGIPIEVSLEELQPTAPFDLITLWHVLEHLHAPAETLSRLHGLASAKAILAIAVPDLESWDAHHYGTGWAALDVPRHLSHFRRQDINRLLQARGFRVLANRRMWFDAPYVCMLSERYHGAGTLTSLIKGASLGLVSNIASMTSSRPTSSTLYLAQKA